MASQLSQRADADRESKRQQETKSLLDELAAARTARDELEVALCDTAVGASEMRARLASISAAKAKALEHVRALSQVLQDL